MALRTACEDMIARAIVVTSIQHTAMWNNQVDRILAEEATTTYAMPALFIEPIWDETFVLGQGVSQIDMFWRLHIVHWELDAANGTMDQNLNVIGLRDEVIRAYKGYKPSGCGGLMYYTEQQDTDHGGVYHYTVDFKCGFIDTAGSPLDPDSAEWITKEPPTGIEITVDITPPYLIGE
jgi:hypothetical protein